MSKRTHVCPHIDKHGRGCPNLQPCPIHTRARSAPWSKHRPAGDRARQHKLRQVVLERDRFTCTRCGHHDPSGRTLQVHHLRATDDYRPEHATTLCTRAAAGCHAAVDPSAR